MLIFALGLIAAACLFLGGLLLFLVENMLALLCAVLVGHMALKTGGGWPSALVAGAAAFTVTSLALRLAASLPRPYPLRLLSQALTIAPAAILGFLLANAVVRPFVPAAPWRLIMSLVAAVSMAAIVAKRQSLSSVHAVGPNR